MNHTPVSQMRSGNFVACSALLVVAVEIAPFEQSRPGRTRRHVADYRGAQQHCASQWC